MNPRSRRVGEAAFGMVEVLAILAVAILLFFLFMPALYSCGGYRKAPRIQCVNNLKNIGLAFRIFATDNNDQFPPALMVSNGLELTSIDILSVYLSLTNELSTPRILHCPADIQRKRADNFSDFTSDEISYFVNLSADETRPYTFLAGDRNLELNGKPIPPGLLILATNSTIKTLGFTKDMHNGQGNIVMGDGSVQQMSSSRLRSEFPRQDSATNYLVIP
jgi:prepilin-type processing-associated H-X9-DG protein